MAILKYKKYLYIFGLLLSFVLGSLLTNFITQVLAHGGDINLIHACVRNNKGDIRIIGPNETCNGNETALDWNIQGSQGGNSFEVCTRCTTQLLLNRLGLQSLVNVQLDYAVMDDVRLLNTDLSGASFKNALFPSGDLRGSNLSNTDFTNAGFIDGLLNDTNSTNVNFAGADFTNAQLTGATTTGANFTNVIWNNTNCPDGTNSDNNGNTCIGHLTP